MKQYQLSEELNESIVDGVIKGYKEYLQVRKEKAKELLIHSAYAYVKGNHIDHHVALECEKHGVEWKKSNAGVTWKFLEFGKQDEKALFLIKNARYFNPDAVTQGKDAFGRTRSGKVSYMMEYAQLNGGIPFEKIDAKALKNSHASQIEFAILEDGQLVYAEDIDIDELQRDSIKRFYIVTYEIDQENYMISSIKVWLPSPHNNKAYLVQDISAHINTKTSHIIEVEEELKAVLQNTDDPAIDAFLYGIELDIEDDASEGEA